MIYHKEHEFWNQTTLNLNVNLIILCTYDFVDLKLPDHQLLHL